MDRRCCSRRIFFSRNRRWYSRFLIRLRSSSLIFTLPETTFQESKTFGGLSALSADLARLQRSAGNVSSRLEVSRPMSGRGLAAFDVGFIVFAMV